jgi:hypothetical protein
MGYGVGMRGRFGLATAVQRVSERASRMARLEVELAKAEMREKARQYGLGIGLGVAAAVFGLFMIGFALAAAAAALDLVVDTWLAILIVAVLLLILTLSLSLVAYSAIKAAGKPVPEEAIGEARLIAATVRGDGTPTIPEALPEVAQVRVEEPGRP